MSCLWYLLSSFVEFTAYEISLGNVSLSLSYQYQKGNRQFPYYSRLNNIRTIRTKAVFEGHLFCIFWHFTMAITITTGYIMCVACLLKLGFGLSQISNFGSAIDYLIACFCPYTLFLELYWKCYRGITCAKFVLSAITFHRGVPGFATDFPCGVWHHGLTYQTHLYVGLKNL